MLLPNPDNFGVAIRLRNWLRRSMLLPNPDSFGVAIRLRDWLRRRMLLPNPKQKDFQSGLLPPVSGHVCICRYALSIELLVIQSAFLSSGPTRFGCRGGSLEANSHRLPLDLIWDSPVIAKLSRMARILFYNELESFSLTDYCKTCVCRLVKP